MEVLAGKQIATKVGEGRLGESDIGESLHSWDGNDPVAVENLRSRIHFSCSGLTWGHVSSYLTNFTCIQTAKQLGACSFSQEQAEKGGKALWIIKKKRRGGGDSSKKQIQKKTRLYIAYIYMLKSFFLFPILFPLFFCFLLLMAGTWGH